MLWKFSPLSQVLWMGSTTLLVFAIRTRIQINRQLHYIPDSLLNANWHTYFDQVECLDINWDRQGIKWNIPQLLSNHGLIDLNWAFVRLNKDSIFPQESPPLATVCQEISRPLQKSNTININFRASAGPFDAICLEGMLVMIAVYVGYSHCKLEIYQEISFVNGVENSMILTAACRVDLGIPV